MASMQSSTLFLSPLSSSSSSNIKRTQTRSAISLPNLKKSLLSTPKLPKNHNEPATEISLGDLMKESMHRTLQSQQEKEHLPRKNGDDLNKIKLFAVLEAVSDRIELHKNIRDQRENWNSLLLNSVNMITLAAGTTAALGELTSCGAQMVGTKISATLLFLAATSILTIMNKIQPSQLVEEQRNAVRLFKQLQTQIEMSLRIRDPDSNDVQDALNRVLALDRAYPLPLLGAMLDKFPKTFGPSVWWPKSPKKTRNSNFEGKRINGFRPKSGWSKELKQELREIMKVINKKDIEDYVNLGNKALKLNKILAISGPLLTGIAAAGSTVVGHGAWVATVAAAAAVVVNTIEHGGQVGMVFEMYRNCAGFFTLLERKIEEAIEVEEENEEVFEMKVGLHLGRSLSELRDLAERSRRGEHIAEFTSKLF